MHSWQTMASCSMHVPKSLGRHSHWSLNVWWMVPSARLCRQNADGVEYRHQMSGADSQQGTSALFREDSGRPERTAGMWLAPELATSGTHEAYNTAGGRQRPEHCWASHISAWHTDGSGCLSRGAFGLHWFVIRRSLQSDIFNCFAVLSFDVEF